MRHRIARLATALFFGGFLSVAQPCSLMRPSDVPFSYEHYVFYGEVAGHSSIEMKRCAFPTEPARCPPSWGVRIRILEPVHVPARSVNEVEYYEFGIDPTCSYTSTPEEFVRKQFPAGTRVALAASLYTAGEPGSRKIRLTTLDPPIFGAFAVLPSGAELRKLAATPFDYAAGDDSRKRFEIWRDKLRLQKSRNEREALAILLRMAMSDELGEFAINDEYSAIEQLVDQYLPTSSIREEFSRSLRDQQRTSVDQ